MEREHPLHSHRKLHIFLITVVVGALLILFLISNGMKDNILTGGSFITKNDNKASSSSQISTSKLGDIEFKLEFNDVPSIDEKTKLKSIEIKADDLNSKIKINNDELTLKETRNIELVIEDFEGNVKIDDSSVSLDGIGGSITINGIELSTKSEMKIIFSNLDYSTLKIEEISLSSIETKKGKGKLSIGQKMSYELSNEIVTLTEFNGDLNIGQNNQSLIYFEGKVTELQVEGEFNLKLGQ